MYILLFPLSDFAYNVDVHTTRKLLFLKVLESRNKSQTLHVSIHNEILAFSTAAWALTKKKKQSVICLVHICQYAVHWSVESDTNSFSLFLLLRNSSEGSPPSPHCMRMRWRSVCNTPTHLSHQTSIPSVRRTHPSRPWANQTLPRPPTWQPAWWSMSLRIWTRHLQPPWRPLPITTRISMSASRSCKIQLSNVQTGVMQIRLSK